MSYNGSGTFNLPTGNPVVSGTTISSTVHNSTMDEIATALSTAILKDGQQTITANIPFNSNKITGLGAGSNAGDAVRLDQVNIVDPPDATDAGTDAYQANFAHDLATGDTVVADIGSANTTATPTLENTGGSPSGAQSIVTTEGAAFAGMLEARPHRFQWDGTNYVVLDPAGGVVEKGSNSNGEYVRFADGTQHVRAVITMTQVNSSQLRVDWTFPAAFTSAPEYVNGLCDATTLAATTPGQSGISVLVALTISASASELRLNKASGASNFGASDTVDLYAVAWGEWA